MAAGEARRAAAGTVRKYLMLDKNELPKWHYVWEGNPNIARPGEPYDGIISYVNRRRPYIVDESTERRQFRPYAPVPAFIALNARAQQLARHVQGAVVFNPTIKRKAPPGKEWGMERWRQLVLGNQNIRWVMVGDAPHRLPGCELIATNSFIEACGVLAGAAAAVVHEGALHHAAAAFGTPTVVIRGGYISPRVTGYQGQTDLYIEDPAYPEFAELGCGARILCTHCINAMESITPRMVAAAVREALKRGKHDQSADPNLRPSGSSA